MEISLNINGQSETLYALPTDNLRDALRNAGYFSIRYGSDDGATGASAVLIDGKLVNSDTLVVGQAVGHTIETVEGLTTHVGEMHPIQKSFIETGAIQSGYATPAMILATKSLLAKNPNPTEADVREAFSGILCRETGYVKPVQAALRAARYLRGEDVEPFGGPEIIDASYLVEMPPAEEGGGDDQGGPAMAGGPQTTTQTRPQTDVLLQSQIPETAVVGKPETKVDAVKLAKGNPAFVDDIEMRGMLHAKILTSPHAHARILEIDDSAALALPGVRAVIHHKKIARVKYASGGQSFPNPHPLDQVSFDNKVRYVGDRVAAVAADTVEIAEQALELIDVTYEILPAVFDETEAIKPGAPIIHDEQDTESIHDASRNIVHHIDAEFGDVEQGFAESDHIFEHNYYVHQVHATPIEPHIAISWWDSDERLVIRSSTQVPFHVRRMVAPLLGLPVSRIRVIKPRIGGGFGVKQEMLIDDVVAHLTIATGKPVRLELNRSEEFRSSRTRHPQTISWKTGVMADGTLRSQKFSVIGNTGAYGTHGMTVQTVTGLRGLSSYNCPNRMFDCYVAYTNLPVPGAYRGYGGPQALFALESHMDEIADEMGIDPIEFRRKNWVQAGDPIPIAPYLGEGEKEAIETIPIIESCGLNECFEQGMKAIEWQRRNSSDFHTVPGKPHLRRGLGAAMCMHGTAIPGLDMGAASIKINDDGSFNLMVGATDLGTGSDTVLAQIGAEVLGVPLEDVVIYSSDTDFTPFDTGAYASSTTYISGTAVKKAAEQLAEQIRERAALMLELDSWEGVELQNRHAIAPDGRSVSLQDIALHSLHLDQQRQLMANASFVSLDSPPPFAGQFAEVEVDMETGQVTVNKLVMAVDAGVPINPITASGQVEGGMTQALGYGHCEEYAYDENGKMINAALGPYHIYRANEMPWMKAILVQTNEPTGPFGAKAIAEIPKDGVAPALANAIFDATGVRIRQIPFTPQRVHEALKQAR
ncbi:MAG: molybdopterin cofactor-binding domain-containing protein [Candidatus Promineifilaceae bacterium]|nr:molybdopterin cofactor-binding domain-containing protein [Candidatus Promineifilaceae bacterium]